MEALMAIVPVKPFAEAKQRLSPVLTEEERAGLARRLLKRTLLKLSRARGIMRVAVVSRDEQALSIAREYGAWSIPETHQELNQALTQATRVAVANGAQAVLMVPTDLPRLRVRDVEKLIALGAPAPRVVIAPAHRDGGTNALLLNPPTLMQFTFGENSFAAHRSHAIAAGAHVEAYQSENVAFDIDVPEDLQRMPNLKSEI